MSVFLKSVFLIAITLFVTQLSNLVVESKALLCHPPPKWTVNNGTDPMDESTGNVTLVTLINASYRFGIKQAQSLENMLRFLRKSGLKDINFIVINSKDLDAKQKFKDLSQKVSFGLYQETEEESVWNLLDGGKDDMFIYDRCGLLTYYIPFPLSIIHAQQPILQAALLSTYFDNPCGETCDPILTDSRPQLTITDSPVSNVSIDTTLTPRPLNLSATVVNMTFESTLSEVTNETKDNQTIDKNSVELQNENVFEYQTTETSDQSIISEDYSGSGSGDQPIDDFIETTTELIETTVENNTTSKDLKEEDEWKVLDFFQHNDNRSDKDVFEEIYNKSVIELEAIANNTRTQLEESTEAIITVTLNETVTTISPSMESTHVPKPTRVSFFNTASRTKCDAFNQSMCIEWSTDRLLRARLCCLSEVLADDDSGFGCGHFERLKCNKMLPLIKCCLKDFSQLLDNYFQSIKDSPRTSRQRTYS